MSADRFEVDTDRLRRAADRLAGLRDQLPEPTVAELPTGHLDAAGLAGWSSGSALARLDADWSAAVRGLADGYADHADQLLAAAARYDDAERIVAHALDDADPPPHPRATPGPSTAGGPATGDGPATADGPATGGGSATPGGPALARRDESVGPEEPC